MSSSDKLCLHWDDFAANIINTVYLKEDKDFTDLTLVCADKQVEVDKVVLASSSNFFKRILKDIKHSHPLIYLSGIKFKELDAVLSFIYLGQVNLAQEDLNSFLAVAEELKVKGLTPEENLANCDANSQTQESSWGKSKESAHYFDHHNYAAPYHPSSPRVRSPIASGVKSAEKKLLSLDYNCGGVPQITEEQQLFSNNPIGEAMHVEDESETNESFYLKVKSENLLASDEDPEKIEHKRDDMKRIERRAKLGGYYTKIHSGADLGKHKCSLCRHLSKRSHSMLDHLESRHFPGMFEYSCDSCDKVFDTRGKYSHHRVREHSD